MHTHQARTLAVAQCDNDAIELWVRQDKYRTVFTDTCGRDWEGFRWARAGRKLLLSALA
jgi:hypothetical protein